MFFSLYLYNKLQHILGLSPIISQLKFYMPSEKLFYGHCNEVKYLCTWDSTSDRIAYVDETTYTGKLSDIEMVAAIGLDDMILTMDVEATSENPLIGCKFN